MPFVFSFVWSQYNFFFLIRFSFLVGGFVRRLKTCIEFTHFALLISNRKLNNLHFKWGIIEFHSSMFNKKKYAFERNSDSTSNAFGDPKISIPSNFTCFSGAKWTNFPISIYNLNLVLMSLSLSISSLSLF